MADSDLRFPRRPLRLPVVFDAYRHLPIYFVTFCTHQRCECLARPEVHAAFQTFIQHAWNEHRIAVGRYVIMPDHIHLLVCGGPGFDLGRWIKMLKQVLGKTTGVATPLRGVDGGKEKPIRLWQEGFFDHLIRRDEKLAEVWDYLRENPSTAGLSKTPTDWPYQGEFIALDRV